MKPTMVHLPPALVERLDRRAVVWSVSRSALIREAIERLLEDGVDGEIVTAYTDGYRALPADAPDEWGDLSSFRQDLRAARDGSGSGGAVDATAW